LKEKLKPSTVRKTKGIQDYQKILKGILHTEEEIRVR
jgi:hypothetical protein